MTNVLEVWLEGIGYAPVRVGLLVKEPNRTIRFTVDDTYIEMGPTRPILGSVWHVPGDDDKTIARLRDTSDKIKGSGFLPGWFGNLLPEGALRNMVEAQMPSGQADEFEIIRRLGNDLPGAVVVREPGSSLAGNIKIKAAVAGTLTDAGAAPAETPSIPGDMPRLKFSLAGVQLKFSAMKQGERLTAPANGLGHIILKLASDRYPDLPALEYASMRLAEAAGVQVSRSSLVPASDIDDIPERLIHGKYALAVERFDRREKGRVHIEDMSQIFNAVGDQKYQRGNEESVIKAVGRFAGPGAAHEAVRRLVVNILIGNTDSHLKNTSLIYPDGVFTALAPAYDIVSIHALAGDDEMALRFAGTKNPRIIGIDRFEHIAPLVNIPRSRMRGIVFKTLAMASETWRGLLTELPLSQTHIARLDAWWTSLALTGQLTSPFS